MPGEDASLPPLVEDLALRGEFGHENLFDSDILSWAVNDVENGAIVKNKDIARSEICGIITTKS
jgi:hypothetical protein